MPMRMMKLDGATVVTVHCDQCHQRIETARDGNVEWARVESAAPGEPAQQSPLFFTHKACSDAFANAHPEVDQSWELTLLPVRLVGSLEINFESAVRSAVRLSSLG